MRWLALVLLLLLPSSAWADSVFDPLLEQLLRLPDHDARRAVVIDKLAEYGDDPLSKERLGTTLSVLGALDADERGGEYLLRLFLGAAMDPDPAVRDDALQRARRGLGPPAGDDRPRTDEAARGMLDRRWLTIRTTPRLRVRRDGANVTLSEFVALTRDDLVRAQLEREQQAGWGVFGGTVAGGVLAAVAGVFVTAASDDLGLDGGGRVRIPNQAAGRATGGVLIGVGATSAIVGGIYRGIVTQRHRSAYRRYYGEDRLRGLVDEQNDREADKLGVTPETD